MSGDQERWRRESEAWKRWEGWVPGDPIPGEIPGLARSDQPTTRHPPSGRGRRPKVVPPPPPPTGAHQRPSGPPPPPPPGAGVAVARSAVRYAVAHTTRARGRSGRSSAPTARGCLVGVVAMLVVFGGLVPACLAAVADRISDEGSSGGFVAEVTIAPAQLDDVGTSPAMAFDVLRDHFGPDLRLVTSIEATGGSVVVDLVPPGHLGELERWTVDGSGVSGPGDPDGAYDIGRVFAVEDARLGDLPGLVDAAPAHARMPDGQVAWVSIQRVVDTPEVRTEVGVVGGSSAGTGQQARVLYDPSGTVAQVSSPVAEG